MNKTSAPLRVKFPAWGAQVLESHHEDDFRMDWTTHRFLKIIYVIEGRGLLRLKGRDVPLRAPSVALVPEGVRHRIVDEPHHALSLYVLCLRPDILTSFRDDKEPVCRTTSQPIFCQRAGQMLRDMLYEQTAGHPAMLVARTLELWALSQRNLTTASPIPERTLPSHHRIEDYLNRLDRSFYQPETLDEAARSAGLSVRRFTQLFRQTTGRSWREEVRHRQIAHARRLLRETGRSVISICFECGFSDLSTFYRSFKIEEALSPQRWRIAHSR